MNNLMIFENKPVEVFEWNGQVLFNHKHVGECLGIKNVNDNIRNMNEKQVVKLTNSKIGNSDFRKLHNTGENFLTESGVYKLIFKSKKKEAERFQDWVTDEVLPQIRKTGGYIPLEEEMSEAEIMAKALLISQKTIEKKDELLKAKNKEIKELKPRADYADLILQNKSLVNVNQIAQDYGLSAQKFNVLLNKFKIQYKQNDQWILFAKYKDCGYVGSETFKFTHKSTKTKDVKMSTKWTQKGRKFLYEFLKEKGILPVMEREV